MSKTYLPNWPRSIPRTLTPRIGMIRSPFDGLSVAERIDAYAVYEAKRRQAINDAIQNTGITGTYNEAFYTNRADFTALASSSAEGSLLVNTPDLLPIIPANHFLQSGSAGRGISILARGVFGTTSTPTLTFQVRLGETAGAAYLSGVSVGVSAAITTASGVSNKWWELRLDLICTVQGTGSNKGTLSGAGYVASPSGFGSPFVFPLEPTTPDTGTWTATFNPGVTQYVNLSATWSASSASNSITCKSLVVVAFG